MGQEAFDTEDCVQEKNKRKGVMNMLRKTKRTLSLVLALIMICSTLGVMAFAAEQGAPLTYYGLCPDCRQYQQFNYSFYDDSLNRVVECPEHRDHDAEERIRGNYYTCSLCGFIDSQDAVTYYVCLS